MAFELMADFGIFLDCKLFFHIEIYRSGFIFMFCKYYQARLDRSKTWFVTGCIRSEHGWVFDRALDSQNNIFEFFVSPSFEEEFLSLMEHFKKEGVVFEFVKLENRLEINPVL